MFNITFTRRVGVFVCAATMIGAATPVLASPVRPAATTAHRPTTAKASAAVSAFTVLHAFSGGSDGADPLGSLLQNLQGDLFGVTLEGGSAGDGTVYESTPAGAITTLHAFSGADGANPSGGLLNLFGNLDLTGNMYGATQSGGAHAQGTVYAINQTGSSFTTLYSFQGTTDGGAPQGRLVLFIDGNLYGTTSSGGTGFGTIFKLSRSGVITTLHTFTGGADGGTPFAGLSPAIRGIGIDGSLYGTTSSGGAFGGGTIFSISPSGVFTVLHSLAPSTDGSAPSAELVPDTNGMLYGTASSGGSGNAGTIFSVTPSGTFTLLYSFPTSPTTGLNPQGSTPAARLAFYHNNKIWGTTAFGGANGQGVVFTFASGTLTVVHSFAGSADGSIPQGQLLISPDGNVFGTTTSGGPSGAGTLFALPE